MLKILIYSILFWASHTWLQAQNRLDWLIKQPAFKPILAEHIHQAQTSGFSTVSALLIKPVSDSLLVYLDSFVYLSEAKKHLPASFKMVDGQPFLLYDGSELQIADQIGWFEKVKSFVNGRLCDDLSYKELLKKPGPKELKVPCEFIYEPPIEKLTFVGNNLVKRQVVSRIPYYRKD